MDEITKDLFQVLHRFHQMTPKMIGTGELPNVEFFILMGMTAALGAKDCCCFENIKEVSAQSTAGITLSEIAQMFGMTASAASKKISILEKKGWVERKPSTKDRRVIFISLTKEGERICQNERQKKQLWVEEMIRRIGVSDVQQLLMLTSKTFDVVEEMLAERFGETEQVGEKEC